MGEAGRTGVMFVYQGVSADSLLPLLAVGRTAGVALQCDLSLLIQVTSEHVKVLHFFLGYIAMVTQPGPSTRKQVKRVPVISVIWIHG